MNDAQLFAQLAKLTAKSMTLEQIEQATGGLTFPERIAGHRTGWGLRVGEDNFSLRRTSPPTARPGLFVIDDPDLVDLADYVAEGKQDVSAMRGAG